MVSMTEADRIVIDITFRYMASEELMRGVSLMVI